MKENLTPIENSNRYFKRYNKLKRTREALTVLIKETKSELDHLESIQASLDMILKEEYSILKKKMLRIQEVRVSPIITFPPMDLIYMWEKTIIKTII